MKSVSKEVFDKAIKSDKLILVDFFATWCGPCQMMAPALEEIEKEYEGKDKVEIIAVDIDENPDISSEYSVMSVPTFLFLKNGEVKETIIGAVAKDVLNEKIEALTK